MIDLFGKLGSEEEKLAYLEAQFELITKLNKQIEQLKIEKKHLEELLKKSPLPVVGIDTNQSDEPEEIKICKDQLKLLHNVSQDRELTMEESRKVDIYAKILLQSKDTDKKKASPVDNMTTKELLKLVGTDELTKNN